MRQRKSPAVRPGFSLAALYLNSVSGYSGFCSRASSCCRPSRGVTADTAVRLAAALGTSERFWLGLQADYDLEEAHRSLGAAVSRIERIAA